MRYSRSREAIELYSDTIMRRETRRCFWVLAALIGSFVLVLSVLTQ